MTTTKYFAQLQAHADVPEKNISQLDLKYSIEFPILCSLHGCVSIKKNGFDKRHSEQPQWFKCNIHGNSFYAHTSWIMNQLSEIIVIRILTALFAGKKPANSLADEFGISRSTISRIIHHNKDYVEYAIETIKKMEEKYMDQIPSSNHSSGIIWLDEIFFKAGKVSFPLILAINSNYQIVGWKLGKTRNGSDIQEVLQQVDERQEWNVLVADGSRAYTKALRERGKDCYFIRHIHSHPWEITEIHKYESLPDGSIIHSIVELRYDALVLATEKPQLGYALEKTYSPKKTTKKRGRPKGSKNKKRKPKKEKEKSKKRGPKTPRSHGKCIQLDMTTNLVDVKYQDPGIRIDHSKKDNPPVPPISVVQEMIWVGFCVFNGSYMTSHLIESKNSLIRLVMPQRGLRTENHLRNHLSSRLEFHSGSPYMEFSAVCFEKRLPVHGSLGFYNLDKFLTISLDNLKVLKIQEGN